MSAGAVGRDVDEPQQQRLHAIVAVERDREIDRLAHLPEGDVRRGDPSLEIVEQHGAVAGLAGDAFVERQDLHELRLGHARGGDQRRRAFDVAALLDGLAEAGDAGLARFGSTELERGGQIQRLRGGFRGCAPLRRRA